MTGSVDIYTQMAIAITIFGWTQAREQSGMAPYAWLRCILRTLDDFADVQWGGYPVWGHKREGSRTKFWFLSVMSYLGTLYPEERWRKKKEPRHLYSFERVCSLFFFLFPLCWDIVDSESVVHGHLCSLDGEVQSIMRRWQPDHSGASCGIGVISAGRVEFPWVLLVIWWGYLYEHGGRILRPAKSLSIDLCGR